MARMQGTPQDQEDLECGGDVSMVGVEVWEGCSCGVRRDWGLVIRD